MSYARKYASKRREEFEARENERRKQRKRDEAKLSEQRKLKAAQAIEDAIAKTK